MYRNWGLIMRMPAPGSGEGSLKSCASSGFVEGWPMSRLAVDEPEERVVMLEDLGQAYD